MTTTTTNRGIQSHFRGALSGRTVQAPAAVPHPDDLNLSEMARAALNYLRGNPDPARNYECKFSLGPLGIPCHVPHLPANAYGFDPISLGDTDSRMDAVFGALRAMCGENEADPVRDGLRARIVGYRRADHMSWVNPAAFVGEQHVVPGEWLNTWTSAKRMYALVEEYQRCGDSGLAEEARHVLWGLRALASFDGDAAWYPGGPAPWKDGEWLDVGWAKDHCRNYPWIVEPCVRYWECTGDGEGLALARAFAEGFLRGLQRNQGDHRIDPDTGAFRGHVHLHTHAVWGVAHLGARLAEPRYLDWARRAYEFVKANGTDHGWYPEFVPQKEYRTEICVVGDMVSIAAWLARGGEPAYWDDVERAVRNQLRQSQFSLTPAFVDLFRKVHADKSPAAVEQALGELRRLEGGFVAQSTFDDWVGYPDNPKLGTPGMYANGIHMMGCCPPEGMRALWEAWCGTVEERPDGLYVNLAFSRDHAAARVTAFRPEDGGLAVEAHKPGDYFLRPPAWAEPASITLQRSGQTVALDWGGPANAYLVCRSVQPGERMTVRWAVPHFLQTFAPRSVPGRSESLTVEWLGNTVLGVAPRGLYLSMFAGPTG